MPELKKPARILLAASGIVAALAYAVIFLLQNSDASTLKTAKEVDAFVIRYCETTARVPSMRALAARFPNLGKNSGWHFFTDARTYLKMQYPVKWWNRDSIGVRKLSEFTATPYAYVVEYRCGTPR